MRKQTDVSGRLLKKKHRKMADGAFPFLRATFYRWVEQWPEVCPRLAERDEDVLLAVGDLHVENFGVWRDSRKRLVWGINDFDEACELPFTSDLVRLGHERLAGGGGGGLGRGGGSGVRAAARRIPGRTPYRGQADPALRRSIPGAGQADEGHAGRSEDVLEKEARPERQPQDRRRRRFPRGSRTCSAPRFDPART